LAGLKSDKATLLQSLKNLENDNDNTKKRINELEKYLIGLEGQGKMLRDRILKYEAENNALDGDINDLDGEIEDIVKMTGNTLGRVK
jgi:chromosome segregation ATPase